MKQKSNYVAALDLGDSKTRALMAELLDTREEGPHLRFLGLGEVESAGWRRGTIADVGQVSHSVKSAVERAELAAGVPLESAVIGIGGPHIQGVFTSCGLDLSPFPRAVTREDIRRVMEAARDIPIPKDREVLHMVPEEFVLDEQGGIRDPIGMRSASLAVKAHIVTGSAKASQSVVTAVNRAGVLVETTVFEAFAAGEVVLSQEEKDLGALVAVLGAGSCDMAVYRRGSLRMAAVIPVGGDHFTKDVAIGLHTGHSDAEIIKKTFGSALMGLSKEGSTIEVPGLGEDESWFAPSRALAEILGSRAEELLGLILDQALRCGMEQQLGAGVILCGGGARLGGMCDLAERILGGPVRLGLPPKMLDMPHSMDSPEYATLLGLLYYSQKLGRLRASAAARSSSSGWKSLVAGGR